MARAKYQWSLIAVSSECLGRQSWEKRKARNSARASGMGFEAKEPLRSQGLSPNCPLLTVSERFRAAQHEHCRLRQALNYGQVAIVEGKGTIRKDFQQSY